MKNDVISKIIEQVLFKQKSITLVIYSTIFCVIISEMICISIFKFLNVTNIEHIIFGAFIEPLLATPPIVLGYCLLRNHLIKNKKSLIQKNKQLTKAILEIKELKGLLQICPVCKKIKPPQEDWTKLEAYIEDHSKAEFTHGICDECLTKFYPENAPGQRD